MQHAILIAYLVSAMTSWVKIDEHAGLGETQAETEARYASIAEDVLDASEAGPMFAGEVGPMRTALLSLAFASFESHYAKRIDECRPGPRESDRDKAGNATAWTLWQMHEERGRPSKVLLCASRSFAAQASLEWLRESFDRCKNLPQLDRGSFYTDGVCRPDWQRSRLRVGRALAWEKAHPIPSFQSPASDPPEGR